MCCAAMLRMSRCAGKREWGDGEACGAARLRFECWRWAQADRAGGGDAAWRGSGRANLRGLALSRVHMFFTHGRAEIEPLRPPASYSMEGSVKN